MYTLFDISTADPGFLPHGNLTKEQFETNKNISEDSTLIIVKNYKIELKYCESCKIVREARMFHCSVCNNCVKVHGLILFFKV